MKIISKFKDYYDYVGQQYGEDPGITWIRGKCRPLARELPAPVVPCHRTDDGTRTDWVVEVLVAGELTFPLARSVTRHNDVVGTPYETVRYQQLDQTMLAWIVQGPENRYRYSNFRVWEAFQENLRKLKREFPQTMRECGSPVFLLRPVGNTRMNVDERIPVLKELGIPALVTAGAMWQNIYSTMTNVMRDNPDKKPPVEISDRDRIVKAGFDLRTSFRDPVNQVPKKKKRRKS